MATEEIETRIVHRARNGVIPNTIFAIAMIAFIVYIVWDFGTANRAHESSRISTTVEQPSVNTPVNTN